MNAKLYLIIGIAISLLLGCLASESSTTPITPTPPLIQLEEQPDYLLQVWPQPASQIKMSLYEANLTPETIYEGPRNPNEQGYKSNICVYLDLAPLVQSGDDLWGFDDLSSRSSLTLNGTVLTAGIDEQFSYVEVKLIKDAPDFVEPVEFGEPYWLCWPVQLETGTHEAHFEFVQTDGTTQEFSWRFAIVDS